MAMAQGILSLMTYDKKTDIVGSPIREKDIKRRGRKVRPGGAGSRPVKKKQRLPTGVTPRPAPLHLASSRPRWCETDFNHKIMEPGACHRPYVNTPRLRLWLYSDSRTGGVVVLVKAD